MISVFLYSVFGALRMFMKGQKRVAISTIGHMEKLRYPSVTFCRRQAFDENIDDTLIHNESSSAYDIEDALEKEISKKEEIVYFLSHTNMTKDNHPCLTSKNSINPGKPCIFPFHALV